MDILAFIPISLYVIGAVALFIGTFLFGAVAFAAGFGHLIRCSWKSITGKAKFGECLLPQCD